MSFEEELAILLNRHSCETESGTPDFILAEFLRSCLDIWGKSTNRRDKWYGHQTYSNACSGNTTELRNPQSE